jgi:hypothetical protein
VSSYYYLMAQLPGILPGTPVALSYERFQETASRFLTDEDCRILLGLSLSPGKSAGVSGSEVVDGWNRRERALRLSLERLRAERLGREARLTPEDEELIRSCGGVQETAATAIGFASPLEAELYLDKSRVDAVTELCSGHYFDSDAVFGYGISLLLRERNDRFAAEAGRESYTLLYKRILGE